MLKNAIKKNGGLDDILNAISNGVPQTIINDGIYLIGHFSLDHNIVFKEQYPELGEYEKSHDLYPYGVCDTIDQWKEIHNKLIDDKSRSFCVSFTEIVKKDQSSDGGWRWHKWGEYIGEKTPQCEYIYDEDDTIISVFVYHIYEL